MFFVICTRIFNGFSPFYGDKRHFHHRLLLILQNEKKVVRTISIMTILTSLIAYFIYVGAN